MRIPLTADEPVCAEWMCETPPRWQVVLETDGSGERDESLAYACKPGHLAVLMRATRHLGVRRIIRQIEPHAA